MQDQTNISLVDLSIEIPTLIIQQKYASTDNFTGRPAPGYENLKPLARPELASILKGATGELEEQGYCLILYDAFRPLKTVQYFIDWASGPENNHDLKARFYPHLPKKQLLEDGYIARISTHSKGLAVDVTLAQYGRPLEMGTAFDFFDPLSHTANPNISREHQQNRQLLKSFLENHGLKNYSKEWWHFSLRL